MGQLNHTRHGLLATGGVYPCHEGPFGLLTVAGIGGGKLGLAYTSHTTQNNPRTYSRRRCSVAVDRFEYFFLRI